MNPYRLPVLVTLITTGCSAKLGGYVADEPVEAGATISGETVVDNAEGRTDTGTDEVADADDDGDDTGDGASAEICDGIDNDGDGEVDEGLLIAFFYDRDGDGWGGANDVACEMPDGAVLTSGDCDDADASVHPDAEEVCNDIDDNCDGATDEGVSTTYFADFDGDGYGSPFATIEACEIPDGYTDNDQDCNDASDLISPEGLEIRNGTDDNCDGEIDEGVSFALYPDGDGDGFGIIDEPEYSCSELPGYTTTSGDCNDEDEAINPEADEICDGVDNDCDGGTDDTTESTPSSFGSMQTEMDMGLESL